MRLDTARLAQLQQLAILDTAPERVYDDIVQLLARSFDAPIAMVNLLDERRDWFKACVGMPLTESPAATSFCEVFFNTQANVLVVEDTTKDERFAVHPLVVGKPHVRFYAAVRLSVAGHTVGTLCAYDMQPRHIEPEQLTEFEVLAKAATALLDLRAGQQVLPRPSLA